MMVLVSYDVSTREPAGARRLRRVAKACRDFGQRVQFSVFEIEVDPAQWTVFKHRLTELIDSGAGQLALYYLGKNWKTKVEHIGAKAALDLNGPLVF
ncbi:hypothetical protein GTA08_BOTSDO14203 [Botryosphaeria dothidea]|uniref:Uncharacterized protein n=1 Tax=Botryosphaeria dothidea TaxID=55169 RepID=A0A8H4IP46_9PEZI|nr:hypothetical protein GTA08_BOTSDO14203 [Botryosphaeria dothidea]